MLHFKTNLDFCGVRLQTILLFRHILSVCNRGKSHHLLHKLPYSKLSLISPVFLSSRMISCGRRLKPSPTNEKKISTVDNLLYTTLHKILSRVRGPVTNNNGFWMDNWIYWHLIQPRSTENTAPLLLLRHVTTQPPSNQSRRGPHRKHLSFLSRIVTAACLLVRYPAMDVLYCRVLLYALFSNGCLPRICLRGNVFIEPLPSSGSIRHTIISTHRWDTFVCSCSTALCYGNAKMRNANPNSFMYSIYKSI
jgi:hypothetical protein